MAVVVLNHVSLDGVMQSPGRPDEDTRNGFAHGGWAVSSDDPAIGRAMGTLMGEGFAWLFGRRSYEDMLQHWNDVGGPFRDGLNATPKYVVTSDPTTDLPWPNSSSVTGDVVSSVATLRRDHPGNLVVMGSGQLIRSLLPHDLVDEILLLIDPLALGGGTRLFPDDGVLRRFDLVHAEGTPSGIVVAHYRGAVGDGQDACARGGLRPSGLAR